MTNSRIAKRTLLVAGLLLPTVSIHAHPCERIQHHPKWPARDSTEIEIPGVLFAHQAMEGLCGRGGRSFHRPFLERSTDTGTGLEIPGCEPGDTLEFMVVSRDTAWYASTARVAPLFGGRALKLLVDGVDATGSVTIPDERRPRWRDVPLPAVKIAAGRHSLRIVFPQGGVKFRFLAMAFAKPGKPTALRAPKAWWPLELGWSGGDNTSSYQILRAWSNVFDSAGATADTTFLDRPNYDSAHFRSAVSYVVVAQNGSLSTLSDTFGLPVIPAGTSLPAIGPVGGWTPQGFLLRWDAVPGALSYGVQGRLGTASPGGYGGFTDTSFFLDPQAVPGVIYRVFPYGDATYYGAPLVGGSVLVPPRP